jgi:hypothetical protein
LFYERAVKRKSISLCWLTFSAAASPTTLTEAPQAPPPRLPCSCRPPALSRSAVATCGLSPPIVGCRPVFYLRLRPLAVFAYCSLRSVPGGIQLSLVLRHAHGAAHRTQAHVILPPNLSGSLPARPQSPGVPASTELYAARFMILSASKFSPLFHTASTAAASLRATERCAISARIPFATSPS